MAGQTWAHKQDGSEGLRVMREVVDGALDAMLIADDAGNYVDVNPAACTLFGVPREGLLRRNVGQLTGSQLSVTSAWQQFLRDGRAAGHFRLLRADGEYRDVDYRATANILPNLHLSVLRDMTERQLAEARFQSLIEKNSDVVLLCRRDASVEYVSPSITAVLGHEPAELCGKSLKELIHPNDVQVLAPTWTSLLSNPSGAVSIEWRARHRDGSWRWLESSARNLLQDPAVKAVIFNLRDITERKQAHELAARLAAIIEASDDAITSSNLEGQLVSWNQGAARLYGWPLSEALAGDRASFIPPERRAFEDQVLRRVLRGEVVEQYDSERLRKDGSVVEVALTVSATRDSAGKISGVAQIARDLTERRKAELSSRRTEERLGQAQKMEAVGALAAGVAHDFNNLLSVIMTYTALIMEELKPDDSSLCDLEEVRGAAERAAELTRQLLALGRQQILEPRVLDLTQIVLDMETTLRRVVSEDIELSVHASPPSARICADPSQMQQVIMNLVVNACDAMPRSGKLTIETANVDLDADSAQALEVAPGPYATLAITDTGSGMDSGTVARIYEPFFTTKETSKSTGLGLSTAFGIVRQSHGQIEVRSAPEQGTTFRVYFPRTERELDVVSSNAPPTILNGSETILLVEDDAKVRLVVGTVLRRHGYQVLEAENGREALLICNEFPGPIELLLTDVVMPRMSGRELADRLAPLRPRMCVVYTSGHTEESIVHHGVLETNVAFLAKPILPATLLGKVREVLDAVTPRRGASASAPSGPPA
jgi:PAS domain S-box-containing protein